MNIRIFNKDARETLFEDESVDLGVFDPPFGIKESSFSTMYNRDNNFVLDGYIEAPTDYYQFTFDWLSQAKRVLKRNGSMYIVSGWSNLRDVLNAVYALDLQVRNHIIWKYNFGVYTKKKYVSSHYHILYIIKPGAIPTFNTYSRYNKDDRDINGGSILYQDLEDVWSIKKQYAKGKTKNSNKLPDSLVEKIILYSSNKDDVVLDLFQGNFTTAYMAIKHQRKAWGTELNTCAYEYHMRILENDKRNTAWHNSMG